MLSKLYHNSSELPTNYHKYSLLLLLKKQIKNNLAANHALKGKNFVADNMIIAEKIVANNIKKR